MPTTLTINKESADWKRLFPKDDPSEAFGESIKINTIYNEGDLSALLDPDRPRVAVIGTRDIKEHEIPYVHMILRHLAENPCRPVILSGLAYGTDTIVHKAALELGLATVAVMATGIDEIYPLKNADLAQKMADTEGCALLTSFPERTAPMTVNFLQRNRLMATLADIVIVPFSKPRGGAVMTATYAFSLARQVYALPGRIDDVNSMGCNELIREGVADILALPARLKLPEMLLRNNPNRNQ